MGCGRIVSAAILPSAQAGNPFYGWVVPNRGTSNRGISSGLSSSFRTARCADWLSGDWPTANTVSYWMPDDRLRRFLPQTGRRLSTLFSELNTPQGSHAWAWSRLQVGGSCSRTAISVPPQSTITGGRAHSQRRGEIVGLAPSERMLRSGGEVQEARRYEKLVLSVPDIYWSTPSG